MSKTQYHSKQNHNNNSNEPEQAVSPKVELLKNTLNGGIQSRRTTIRNSTATQEECKKSAHLRHSADVSRSKRTITRAFSDACESAQELPSSQGPGIERLGLEEWRRIPAPGKKKIDGHVKFSPSKQPDFRI
jgi:hypothetical protein